MVKILTIMFQIWMSSQASGGRDGVIKHVVYEEFCICESTGSGLLIKPVVYEEFDVAPQQRNRHVFSSSADPDWRF